MAHTENNYDTHHAITVFLDIHYQCRVAMEERGITGPESSLDIFAAITALAVSLDIAQWAHTENNYA